MFTPAVEDYLKTIYDLQREQGQVATTSLAERVGVAPASATNMVKKLAEMGLGQSATIAEVSDRDPELLRYLGRLGLYPGAVVYLVAATPFDDTLRVRVGADEWALGRQAAGHIFVTEVTKPGLPQSDQFLSRDRRVAGKIYFD